MTQIEEVTPPEPGSGEFRVGCVAGLLSGIIGNAVATAALIILHPDWLFGTGDPLGRIIAGLAIGWAGALVIAVIASLVLIRLISLRAGDAPASSRTAAFNVVVIYVVPAAVAAGAFWLFASVNR
jgi:hypothetical protein